MSMFLGEKKSEIYTNMPLYIVATREIWNSLEVCVFQKSGHFV